MHSEFDQIQRQLKEQRDGIVSHALYSDLDTLRQIQAFMEHHVFAVWDFMSLLKALQRSLGSFAVPWVPSSDVDAVRFVNEIALGEESDQDGRGGYQSHFELYLDAMRGAGASTARIEQFLLRVREGLPIERAISESALSLSVASFLSSTFEVIERNDPAEIAGAFLFGREDLLPDVFTEMVRQISFDCGGRLDALLYYLQRHIELDAEDHQPAARRLIESLCGESPERWARAKEGAFIAYSARKRLWDGALQEMRHQPQSA